MKILSGFTSQPDQELTHRIETGENVKFRFTYKARAQMWFLDVTYGTKIIKGLRISNFPNILRQFRNNIPFGLLPIIAEESEPLLINDLESGRLQIGILNESEVDQIEVALNSGSVGCE